MSLANARASAQRAALTARSSASTARQLATGMSVTIFGLQPLAQLGTSFETEAADLDALGTELDTLATSLSADETNVAALREQVAALQSSPALTAAGAAARVPLAPVFYALLVWLAVQALAAVAFGVALWRTPVVARSGRAQHAA